MLGNVPTMKLKIKTNLSAENLIQNIYSKYEIPFMGLFGKSPNFTITVKEQDGVKLLKPENTTRLNNDNIKIAVPPELKARRSVFVRKIHPFVGLKTDIELADEIERLQDWAKVENIIKIKDYTHVIKIEFTEPIMAQKATDVGLLIFGQFIAPNNIKLDEFIAIQTCFNCYKYEEHATPKCDSKKIVCSECSAEGHRFDTCTSIIKNA